MLVKSLKVKTLLLQNILVLLISVLFVKMSVNKLTCLFFNSSSLNFLCFFFQSMAALLRPFGICADFLNPNVMLDILAPGLKKAIKYVQSLEEKDFKEKVSSLSSFSLLKTIFTKFLSVPIAGNIIVILKKLKTRRIKFFFLILKEHSSFKSIFFTSYLLLNS